MNNKNPGSVMEPGGMYLLHEKPGEGKQYRECQHNTNDYICLLISHIASPFLIIIHIHLIKVK